MIYSLFQNSKSSFSVSRTGSLNFLIVGLFPVTVSHLHFLYWIVLSIIIQYIRSFVHCPLSKSIAPIPSIKRKTLAHNVRNLKTKQSFTIRFLCLSLNYSFIMVLGTHLSSNTFHILVKRLAAVIHVLYVLYTISHYPKFTVHSHRFLILFEKDTDLDRKLLPNPCPS